MVHTILIRTASAEELRSGRWGIGGTDQAGIVQIDGEVVCWTDDYGTARPVTNGRDISDLKGDLESVAQAAFDLHAQLKLEVPEREVGDLSDRDVVRGLADEAINLVAEIHSAIYNPDDHAPAEPKLARLERILRSLR